MTLRSAVVNLKRVPAGTGVSYGPDHVTAEPTTLALVPIGFADGLPRSAEGRARGLGRRRAVPDRRADRDGPVRRRRRRPAGARSATRSRLRPGAGRADRRAEWARWAGTNPHEVLDRHRRRGCARSLHHGGGGKTMKIRSRAVRRPQRRARGVPPVGGEHHGPPRPRARTHVTEVLIGRDGQWHVDRHARSPSPAALDVLGAPGRRLPGPARPVRRGRHRAVDAGVARRRRTSATGCWPARPAWTRRSPRRCSPPTACASPTG